MVVTALIGPRLLQPAKAVDVELPDEGAPLALLRVQREQVLDERLLLMDAERPAVRHPADHVVEPVLLRVGQQLVQHDGEVVPVPVPAWDLGSRGRYK